MKRLALFIALVSSMNLKAQKFELGLGGGVGSNSIPTNAAGKVIPASAKNTYNYAFSIKAFTNVMHKWQFGLGIDMQPISRKSDTTLHIFASPATTIYTFANHTLGEHLYAGIRFGLIAANNSYSQKFENNNLTPVQINYDPATGYTGGLHFGYTKYLGKYFDLNAELGANYANTVYSYTRIINNVVTSGTGHYGYMFYSLTIGLRMKMFNDPFRQW